MDEQKKEYRFSAYCWDDEDSCEVLMSEILMEVSGDFEEFCKRARDFFESWEAPEEGYIAYDYKETTAVYYEDEDGYESYYMIEPSEFLRIHGFCNESEEQDLVVYWETCGDPILQLLYFCVNENLGVMAREITCSGDSYTDFSEMAVLSHLPLVSFLAKKDGGDTKLYYWDRYQDMIDAEEPFSIGKQQWICKCKREPRYAYSSPERFRRSWETGPNPGEFDGDPSNLTPEENAEFEKMKKFEEDIMAADGGRLEVGDEIYYWEDYEIWQITKFDMANPDEVPVCIQTNGKDFTFSIRVDDTLYKKISKDDEKVVFYDTPYAQLGSDKFKQDGNPQNVVFENIDGQYRYQPADKAESRFKDVIFSLPQMPDSGRIDPNTANNLFREYLCAFYDAFSRVEEYAAKIGGKPCLFRRVDGEEDDVFPMFRATFGDFVMTGKLALPLTNGCRFTQTCLCDTYDMERTCYINMESVAFEKDNIKCTMILNDDSTLAIYVEDTKTGDTYRGTFDELHNNGVFLGRGLSGMIRFDRQFASFEENIGLYRIIKDTIVACGAGSLNIQVSRISREEIKKCLYPDDKDWETDENVVDFALELHNYYKGEGKIPNIAIVGEAGTGKSTLAKKIGKEVFNGREVLHLSPSDLRGSWIGHTMPKIAEKIVKAAAENEIIFIDEAYQLTEDQFGMEAVAFLLPLMSGEKEEFETNVVETFSVYLRDKKGERLLVFFKCDRNDRDTLKVYRDEESGKFMVEKNGEFAGMLPYGLPPIWVGGYEDEIRLLLRQNQGLYRRFYKCKLAKPRTDQLYRAFKRQLKEMKKDEGKKIEPRILNTLEALFTEHEELIKDFFRWGSQPQFSKYFANYAGVGLFLRRCLYMGDVKKGNSGDKQGSYNAPDIKKIIGSMKDDIKRQHSTVRLKGGTSSGVTARTGSGNSNASLDAFEQVQVIVDNKTRFKDVAGSAKQFKSQVDYMKDIICMLMRKDDYEALKIAIPKGVLMLGEPGVGKTFLARAMAGELEEMFKKKAPTKRVGFLALSAPELTSKPVSFIGSIFDSAGEYDACVMFIDEVDAIAKRRSYNAYYSHLIELIKQMDGIEGRSNIFIMAATNVDPDSLDPAFIRSGRIDKKLFFELPDLNTRHELAKTYITDRRGALVNFTGGKKADKGIDRLAQEIAKKTPGRTPGDIDNMVKTAFIEYLKAPGKENGAGKYGHPELNRLSSHLDEAIETYKIGDRRAKEKEYQFSVEKNDNSCSSTAIHEVGHALVMVLSGNSFEKITILGRGSAGGYVRPEGELSTKADYENDIRATMGGRIAEEIVYGKDQVSAGAYSDMRRATNIVRWMVESVGFSDEFGFMALTEDTARYLGESGYSCSLGFREKSDRAVNELLKKLYQETKGMLADKREIIIALAEEVFKKETMTGEEFKRFYEKINKKIKFPGN